MSEQGKASDVPKGGDKERFYEHAVIETRQAFERQNREIISERESFMRWIRFHFVFLALAFATVEFANIKSSFEFNIVFGIIIATQFLGILILSAGRRQLGVHSIGFHEEMFSEIWNKSSDYQESLQYLTNEYGRMVDHNRQ